MKKILFSFLSFFVTMNLVFAGGLVTNTNQSAAWARMLVRDASTSIDAAYFNPAGLTKLSDGFHLSLSNQSIFQDRTISNSLFPGEEWNGSVTAPIFPNLYAAYKTGKFAFSIGFMPIGGGGSANFDNGIPSIELLVGQLPAAYAPVAAGLGTTITGYNYNASFEGTSVYYGLQGGISYAITDMISAYAGIRYVIAKNSYAGTITDITLTTAEPGTITEDRLAAIPPFAPYAAGLANKELDVDQDGTGITPILGANIALMENALNIGIKYEFQTNMDVTNSTAKDVMIGGTPADPITMYPDGDTSNADIPAMLTVGLSYKISDKLTGQIGYHTYFDNKTGWSEIDNPENPSETVSVIDKNYWELGVGFEYSISEKLLLSLGYLRAQTGVNDYYQSDLSYSLSSNTFGLGGAYRINDMINLNLGGYYTMYQDATAKPSPNTPYDQTYKKTNFGLAIGVDFAFGGK